MNHFETVTVEAMFQDIREDLEFIRETYPAKEIVEYVLENLKKLEDFVEGI